MSFNPTNADNPACAWYRPKAGQYDEAWTAEGALKPHWALFIQALQSIGCGELEQRRVQGGQFLRENGVTYNVYGDPEGLNRPWELDPVPLLIGSEEWSGIEAGLMQRAELLNLILADIYGPRELIRKGLLPLELIYGHRGFLRPCDRVRLPGEHQSDILRRRHGARSRRRACGSSATARRRRPAPATRSKTAWPCRASCRACSATVTCTGMRCSSAACAPGSPPWRR